MARKQEIVAMLLAGGQGTRLQVLTKDMAKPAVPFGGKYRIIDFSSLKLRKFRDFYCWGVNSVYAS